MSTDWTAYTVIGVEVTGKTKKVVVERNCDHSVRSTAKFCDECGKPITRTFAEGLPEFSYETLQFNPLHLIRSTDGKREFFGFSTKLDADDPSGAIIFDTHSLTGIPELMDRAREMVEEYLNKMRTGFWNEVADSYGIWTVMHCSY